MSNRSHDRSPSPNVFVRHPHCFVPISGQNIPPPPNWKPPPLPSDVDDVSGNTSNSIKSNQSTVSSVSDSDHLSVPNIKTKSSMLNDTPSKKNKSDSLLSSESSHTPVSSTIGSRYLTVPSPTQNNNSILETKSEEIETTFVSIDANLEDVQCFQKGRLSTDLSRQESEPKEEVTSANTVEEDVKSLDVTHNSSVSPIKEKGLEEKVKEVLNRADELVEEINEVNQDATNILKSEKTIENPVDKIKHDSPTINVSEEITNPVTLKNDDLTASSNDTTEVISDHDTTSSLHSGSFEKEKSLIVEKSIKKEKKSNGSINISKLEDELDLLPIPDFPSLDATQQLEVPMPEFPVPENDMKTEHQKECPSISSMSTSNKELAQNEVSKISLDRSVDQSSLTNDRNRDITKVKSMESNLESITSALKLPNVDHKEFVSDSKEISNKSSANPTEDSYSINRNLKLNENASPKDYSTNPNRANNKVSERAIKTTEKEIENLNMPKTSNQDKSDLARKPSIRHRKIIDNEKELTIDTIQTSSSDATGSGIKPASLISRIKTKAHSDRRNSLAKTLTRLEPYLLVASSPPEGIRSQRLAELGVTCVVHAATIVGDSSKTKGFITSSSDGIDIVNANLEDGGNNLETFDNFGDKIKEVKQKKGVALIISDESSPSISQR